MRLCIILLLAGLAPQDAAPPPVDEDFKDLQDDDAAVRMLSFEELREVKAPVTQSRLRKSVGTIASSWMKKAVSERTRAVRSLSAALHKGFNPADFAAKQKKALDLLAAGDTRSMEPIVKDLW